MSTGLAPAPCLLMVNGRVGGRAAVVALDLIPSTEHLWLSLLRGKCWMAMLSSIVHVCTEQLLGIIRPHFRLSAVSPLLSSPLGSLSSLQGTGP
jgi:hypothetical protein